MNEPTYHNQITMDCLTRIMADVPANGGDFADMLVILESLVSSIFVTVIKEHEHERAMEVLLKGCQVRMADMIKFHQEQEAAKAGRPVAPEGGSKKPH